MAGCNTKRFPTNTVKLAPRTLYIVPPSTRLPKPTDNVPLITFIILGVVLDIQAHNTVILSHIYNRLENTILTK
jgi:hypothetical protein